MQGEKAMPLQEVDSLICLILSWDGRPASEVERPTTAKNSTSLAVVDICVKGAQSSFCLFFDTTLPTQHNTKITKVANAVTKNTCNA